MKTMCPPGYHHNGFVATHALGHMNVYVGHVHTYLYMVVFISSFNLQNSFFLNQRSIYETLSNKPLIWNPL